MIFCIVSFLFVSESKRFLRATFASGVVWKTLTKYGPWSDFFSIKSRKSRKFYILTTFLHSLFIPISRVNQCCLQHDTFIFLVSWGWIKLIGIFYSAHKSAYYLSTRHKPYGFVLNHVADIKCINSIYFRMVRRAQSSAENFRNFLRLSGRQTGWNFINVCSRLAAKRNTLPATCSLILSMTEYRKLRLG